MANLDYHELYILQDRVLHLIFAEETEFYLTGGTCLHRFYFEQRYSDDLDCFTSANNQFHEDVRLLMDRFGSEFLHFQVLADTRDFVRLSVQDALRIDLVNDRVYRHGRSLRNAEGIVLDNLENIAANKVCALIGRDDPKDVFDLYTMYSAGRVDWKTVLSAAARKCTLEGEILEYRLKSFPLELLKLLNVRDASFLRAIQTAYSSMVQDILDNMYTP